MATRLIGSPEITRPPTTPLTSSILDHAVVKGIDSFGLRNNEGLWLSYNCLDTLVPTPYCPDPTENKTFDFGEWMGGFEFAVHGGVQCQAVGLDAADQKSELERVFRLNEGKGVERALLENTFAETGVPDLTPATEALNFTVAVSVLEGYAAAHYAGVPTLHLPRVAATLMADRIVWEGDKAFTRAGSKVAFGGGYDSLTAPDGTWDLFATGEVYVERSKEISHQQWVVPGDGTDPEVTGFPENSVIALVERMYRVGVDCLVVKATATVW